jgi:hypothetical protein
MKATALVQKPNGADPTGTVARLSNGRGILAPWNADVSSLSRGRFYSSGNNACPQGWA